MEELAADKTPAHRYSAGVAVSVDIACRHSVPAAVRQFHGHRHVDALQAVRNRPPSDASPFAVDGPATAVEDSS